MAVRQRRAQEARDPLLRQHPALGWEKKPGAEADLHRPEYKTHLTINQHGLRGPDRDYDKPAGTRRVLLVGDSFVEGYTVGEESTVRHRLEAALRTDGTPWEVLNAGTRGYSTDQEWQLYETEGRRYAPDVVVLFFYYNDLEGNGCADVRKPCFAVGREGRPVLRRGPLPADSPRGFSAPDRQLPRPTWLGSVALGLLSRRTRDANPALHRRLAGLGVMDPGTPEPVPAELAPFLPSGDEPAWVLFAALLDVLRRDVERDGATLVVVDVPARFELSARAFEPVALRHGLPPGSRFDAVAARLIALCRARGLTLVDPTSALAASGAAGSPAYFHRDGHWNEEGHRIVAGLLAEAIRRVR